MATHNSYSPFTDYSPSKCNKNPNEYMTPDFIWDYIIPFLDKDKVIWEAFYGDGESGKYLKSKGFNVIHEQEDFFENDKGDLCVSNPPFQYKRAILERLVLLNKPFILIVPVSTINYQYTRILGEDMQILLPPRRMKFKYFDKVKQQIDPDWDKKSPAFDSIFLCWKMGFDKDLIFL